MADVSQDSRWSAAQSAGAGTSLVLDTNIVLDWLWFEDPRTHALKMAITSGQVRWLATPHMQAELVSVLDRMIPRKECQNKERVLTSMKTWVSWVEPPAAVWRLKCTDPDDQPFIDLAVCGGARWLLSRDRAVLKLAPRARQMGCEFTTPEQVNWTDLVRLSSATTAR